MVLVHPDGGGSGYLYYYSHPLFMTWQCSVFTSLVIQSLGVFSHPPEEERRPETLEVLLDITRGAVVAVKAKSL